MGMRTRAGFVEIAVHVVIQIPGVAIADVLHSSLGQ